MVELLTELGQRVIFAKVAAFLFSGYLFIPEPQSNKHTIEQARVPRIRFILAELAIQFAYRDVGISPVLILYQLDFLFCVYFRDCKNKLALDHYQIRSAKGIKRLWLIASLVYLLACLESHSFKFSEGFHVLSTALFKEQVAFIFDYAMNGGDKSALLQKIA